MKVCREGGWDALRVITKAFEKNMGRERVYKLYARKPEEVTRDLVARMYGEAGEELI